MLSQDNQRANRNFFVVLEATTVPRDGIQSTAVHKVGELSSIRYSAALLIRQHASFDGGSGSEHHR